MVLMFLVVIVGIVVVVVSSDGGIVIVIVSVIFCFCCYDFGVAGRYTFRFGEMIFGLRVGGYVCVL